MKVRLSIFGIVILCWGCAAIFAPRITDTGVHRMVTSREQCLSCHLEGKNSAPKAPDRMLENDRRNCVRCHR